MNFRLIGIKTGSKLNIKDKSLCDFNYWTSLQNIDYLKVLEPNYVYSFFDCYNISKDASKVEFIPEKQINNLYQFKKNKTKNITISAIVGENGSGKSTILETLYLAIYNLSVFKSILHDDDRNLVTEYQNYLRCDLFFVTDENEYYKLNFHFDTTTHQCTLFKAIQKKSEYYFNEKSENLQDFKLDNFFYCILVNYSIYGLNSSRMGDWIKPLFHKNDSYQTPLVINPMRNKGNFDINREEYLTKYRLLTNSIIKYKNSPGKVKITDNQHIENLTFKIDLGKISFLESNYKIGDNLKERKIEKFFEENFPKEKIEDVIKKIIKVFTKKNIDYTKVEYKGEIEKYIIKKLYRIAFIYKKYWEYIDFSTYEKPQTFISKFKVQDKKFDKYILRLSEDGSHTTMKLRQAINYLVNDPLNNLGLDDGETKKDVPKWIGTNIHEATYKIQFERFAKRLLNYNSRNIINQLPPSIFKIVINVKNEEKNTINELDKLSSGEMQLINSLQSSIYHINNLNSYSDDDYTDNIKYKNVLLIFDEIELYFHPEYQRKIISNLIDEIDQLNLSLIKNIQVLFVTHSPFILSDIPHYNQLLLKKGKSLENENKTFAASIYELLQDSFFLKENTGKYSISVINGILYKINSILDEKKKTRPRKKIIQNKISELKKNNSLQTIQSIGDSLVRNQLEQMYFESIDDKNEERKYLEKKINEMKNQLENIK